MRMFLDEVRPLGGLLLDGLAWGAVVGFAGPLLGGLVGGVLGASPELLLIGVVYGLVGFFVGAFAGGVIGLAAGLLFEAWSLLRAPALVVALGSVAPVLLGLFALSRGPGEGWGTVVAVVAAGPLVADVLHRAQGLAVARVAAERGGRSPLAAYAGPPGPRPQPQDAEPSAYPEDAERAAYPQDARPAASPQDALLARDPQRPASLWLRDRDREEG